VARKRTPREEVLRRCFELSWPDLVEVWRIIGSYLQPAGETETEVTKQLRERAQALDYMKQAAEHLGLPAGTAPTGAQYEQARKELGLPLTRRQIELRWEGWRFATLHYRGFRAVETPAQRALRRKTSGRRSKHEGHLAGVRLWLETKPEGRAAEDYDYWRQRHNEQTDGLQVVKAEAVRRALNLPWSYVLRVADFEMELEEAQAENQARTQQARGALDLASRAEVAHIYGVDGATADSYTRQPGFPPPVAILAGARVWYLSDVEAHHAGRPYPARREGELQDALLDVHEVAEQLLMKEGSLRAALHENRPTVPKPAGQVSKRVYWLREDFEAWLSTPEQQRRLDARRRRQAV
jgi:predicted DNA-binding transcriptional regulator AlpA